MSNTAEKLQIIPAANEKACIKLLREAYKQNLTDHVITVIKDVRSKKRKCHNEGLLVDLDLIPDSQIITFTDEKGLKWCFERETIPELLKTGQNPWTKQKLPPEFLETLKKAEVVPALPLDDAIKEVFGEIEEVQTYEKSKMIDEIDTLLSKGLGPGSEDPYVSVNSFLEKERKFKLLPWHVEDEEEQIKYLYNLRNTMLPIAGNPVSVAYLLVKYADNAVIIDDPEISEDGKAIAKEYNAMFEPLLKARLGVDEVFNSMMSKIVNASDKEMDEIIKEFNLGDIPENLRCGGVLEIPHADRTFLYITLLIQALNANRLKLADQLVRVGKIKDVAPPILDLCKALIMDSIDQNWMKDNSHLFSKEFINAFVGKKIALYLDGTVSIDMLTSPLITVDSIVPEVMKLLTAPPAMLFMMGHTMLAPIPDQYPKVKPLLEKLSLDEKDYQDALYQEAVSVIKNNGIMSSNILENLQNNGIDIKSLLRDVLNAVDVPSLEVLTEGLKRDAVSAKLLNSLQVDKTPRQRMHLTEYATASEMHGAVFNVKGFKHLLKIANIEPFLKKLLGFTKVKPMGLDPSLTRYASGPGVFVEFMQEYYILAKKYPKFRAYLKSHIPGRENNYKEWTTAYFRSLVKEGPDSLPLPLPSPETAAEDSQQRLYALQFYLTEILPHLSEAKARDVFTLLYTTRETPEKI